jgi:hypothetical protein
MSEELVARIMGSVVLINTASAAPNALELAAAAETLEPLLPACVALRTVVPSTETLFRQPAQSPRVLSPFLLHGLVLAAILPALHALQLMDVFGLATHAITLTLLAVVMAVPTL